MKKYEKGVLSVEASIVLTLFTFFVLFLFNFASIYTAQTVVSHATIQAADAVAIESYLRETADEGDAEDIVYLTSQITDSTSISADSFESLRTADLPVVAKQKFVSAVSNTESKADRKLEALGVQDGLQGVDFNSSYVDLNNDDVIVAVSYTLDLKFPVFTAKEVTLTKTAKAKTFGEILFGVTTKPNNPQWGVTGGDDEVEQGETVVITATPNHGYRFVKWNDGVTDNPRTVLVTEAKKYVAIFEPSGYGVNIKVNNPAWGSASGGGTYDNMATATISATPKQHYQFVGWDYDGDGAVDHKEPTRNLVVNKTYTITAIFEPVSYTITVKSNNSDYGSALATNDQGKSGTTITAKYGSYVTLTATSKNSNYYEFEKWSNGAKQTNTKVLVEGNATYTANFKLSTWTVNFYNGSTLYATVTVYKDSSVSGSGKSMPSTSSLNNFARWRTSDGSLFNEKTIVKSDLNVYAKTDYTVTLNPNKGTVPWKSKTQEVGNSVTLPTPELSNHTFQGWQDSNGKIYSGGKSYSFNSSITLTAKWTCNHTVGKVTQTHETYCRDIYSNGKLKSGVEKPYRLYRCETCGDTWKVENESLRKHYRMDYSQYADGGTDDFTKHCNKKHSDTHYGYCGKYWTADGSQYHDWDGHYHILCSYCHKEEQGYVWCYVDGKLLYYNLHKCAIHNGQGTVACPF